MGHYFVTDQTGEFNGFRQMDTNKRLVDAVLASADDAQGCDDKKSLTCSAAFELARKFDVQLGQIGRICNQHNVKICKCQLGCFK